MAESAQQAVSTAALETSLQDQLKAGQDDFQHSLSLLGRELERLMDSIKGEQGEIQVRLDTEKRHCSTIYERYR